MFEYYSPYTPHASSNNSISSSRLVSASAHPDRPFNMFDSVKLLLQSYLGGSRSNKAQNSREKKTKGNRKSAAYGSCPSVAYPISQSEHKRSAYPTSMAEYLSLEQLEGVWWQQDTRSKYLGRSWDFQHIAAKLPTNLSQRPRTASTGQAYSITQPAHRCPDIYMHDSRTCCHFL